MPAPPTPLLLSPELTSPLLCRLDPGHVCASFWHAAVCGELGEVIDVPSAAPGDYVAKLFDGYADRCGRGLL